MLPQIVYAQYGNSRSYYGNIQLGSAPKIFQPFGAWPEDKPPQQEMLIGDWQEKAPVDIKPDAYQSSEAEAHAARNIEIIRHLRAELRNTEDNEIRHRIREQIDVARKEKVRAFRVAAQVDEDETLFILLH